MVTTIVGHVHCIVTSPPYFGLRDYGAEGQIGLEATPDEYIDRLVSVFREARRVLRTDGTLWVNIGDSYAGSGKGSAHYPESAMNTKQGTNRGMIGAASLKAITPDGCKPKDLIGIPWMLAFALRSDGWYLRQDIIWDKPNCMPESVTDRCTKSHEYLFLLSKSRTYYFDSESIKESRVGGNDAPVAGSGGAFGQPQTRRRGSGCDERRFRPTPSAHFGGHIPYSGDQNRRNKRSVWQVPIKPYRGDTQDAEHFATYPVELVIPCINAGCPEGGIVLDPFFGSGTTGEAASILGRDCIGIEINPKFAAIAMKRNAQLTLYDIGRNEQARTETNSNEKEAVR